MRNKYGVYCCFILTILLLTACGKNEKPVQEGPREVVLGTASLPSGEKDKLGRAILQFNESQSEYVVRLEDTLEFTLNDDGSSSADNDQYTDATERLRIDLATGQSGYDLLALDDYDYYNMDIESLCKAGAFEDLNIWLDQDGGLEREDFFNMPLTAYDQDGTLFALPAMFSFNCLKGRQALLGDRTEWTLREFLDYTAEHPDMRITDLDIEGYMLLHLYLNGTFSFVEPDENGELVFDEELCADYLEFLKGVPDRRGDYALARTGVNFNTAQLDRDYLQDTFTYIGYPSQDRQNGYIVDTVCALSICSSSDCKEGAWAFLEFYLQYQDNTENIIGVNTVYYPALKKQFDAAAEEILYKQWARDENGEILLDEEGNPKMSEQRWADTYVYRAVTEEDVAFLRDFLSRGGHLQLQSTGQLYNIFAEESKAYFNDQKTLDEVMEIIKRRTLLYYEERS